MEDNKAQKITGWEYLVFFLGAGAYVPIMIGGWQHPAEINLATYSLWFILCSLIAYSSWKRRYAGWFMPLGWVFGQGMIITTAFLRGGYTFNLGQEEIIVFYGIIITLSLWGTLGQLTGKWDPRILYLGSILADMLSFYPQIKQYLLPHEPATIWLTLGWSIFIIDILVNLLLVEHLPEKLLASRAKPKEILHILEHSLLSIENLFFLTLSLVLMLQ